MTRVVSWFSAGAASAVATKLALIEGPVSVVYIETGAEHPDNARFVVDCAEWFGVEIETIKSDRYESTWGVWEKRRFLNSPAGALCTAELKRRPRFAYQRGDDRQVFGYTAEESSRADRFRHQSPGVDLWTPLIDRGLTKPDCLAMIDRAGIRIPVMYELGYRNNNCIGCVKGGMGYWNKIRRDFPDVFARMASLERDIGASCIRTDGESVFLDSLDPDRGLSSEEPDMSCSLLCVLAEDEVT